MISEAEIGAVVLGVTEIIKSFGFPRKWLPVFAILLGVAIAMIDAYRSGTPDWFLAAIRGIVVGATATGLYAAGKGFIASAKK